MSTFRVEHLSFLPLCVRIKCSGWDVNNNVRSGWDHRSVAERSPGVHEALGLICSITHSHGYSSGCLVVLTVAVAPRRVVILDSIEWVIILTSTCFIWFTYFHNSVKCHSLSPFADGDNEAQEGEVSGWSCASCPGQTELKCKNSSVWCRSQKLLTMACFLLISNRLTRVSLQTLKFSKTTLIIIQYLIFSSEPPCEVKICSTIDEEYETVRINYPRLLELGRTYFFRIYSKILK